MSGIDEEVKCRAYDDAAPYVDSLSEQQQQSLLYSDQKPTYSMNVFARALIHNLERDLEGTQQMQSNLEWVEDMWGVRRDSGHPFCKASFLSNVKPKFAEKLDKTNKVGNLFTRNAQEFAKMQNLELHFNSERISVFEQWHEAKQLAQKNAEELQDVLSRIDRLPEDKLEG